MSANSQIKDLLEKGVSRVIDRESLDEIGLLSLVKAAGFAATTGEAKTAITGGGVKVNGEKVLDERAPVKLSRNKGVVLQVGKKKFKLVFAK